MRTRGVRLGTTIAVLATTSSLLLASCSSDEPAPVTSASASAVASATADASASASASSSAVAATGAAAGACAAYFELDLLNSAYAGGAVADGDMTEAQVKEQFQSMLKDLVQQTKAAVADGSVNAKMLVNAKRMKKLVKQLSDQQSLSDLSKKKQTRFAKSSLRVQKACDAAGVPLPADNVTARTAAGI